MQDEKSVAVIDVWVYDKDQGATWVLEINLWNNKLKGIEEGGEKRKIQK